MRPTPTPHLRTLRSTHEVARPVDDVLIERLIEQEPVRITLVENDRVTEEEDSPAERPLVARVAKRTLDIAGALVLLMVSLPVFLLIAIAIRMESRGPVFFSHRRLGREGRLFPCLKFRTMYADAEEQLHRQEGLRHHYVTNNFKIPAEHDPRITPFGRFLRQSSLDELPQLVNVLLGDMSLVGPRPIVPLEATHYGDRIDVLLSVRPGLTGAWAVGGRSSIGYPERASVELDYVKQWSLLSDARILLTTPTTVLTRRGAI